MLLDHTVVPFRKRAVYLRLVVTKSQAADYAAGGFHVSVTRSLCGGAADSSSDFASGGTTAGVCLQPLHRDDIGAAWGRAAMAYQQAYTDAMDPSAGVDYVKMELDTANELANAAYAMEGVAPPVDPMAVVGLAPAKAEPAAAPSSKWPAMLAGLAIFGMACTAAGLASRG